MYFELMPKEKEEDFYNYKNELNRLLTSIKQDRIIVVKGVRRVGKSSLMRVARGKLDLPSVWVDGRTIYSKDVMYNQLERALRRLVVLGSWSKKVEVKNIDVFGIELQINQEVDVSKAKGVIFVDEAQLLSDFGFDQWLGYVYDNLKDVRVVLAGSQVGLLEKLLGSKRMGGMKGRVFREIVMKPLTRELAVSFLLEGFSQVGKRVDLKEVEDAVDTLGGLIGWLTYYGYERLYSSHSEAMNNVKLKAREILLDELETFLEHVRNKKAYLFLLKGCAMGLRRWEDLKNFLIANNIGVSEGFVSKAIERLIDYSFITRDLRLTDPLMKDLLLS